MTHLPVSLEAAAARISLNHILDNGPLVGAALGFITGRGIKHRLFIPLNFDHLRSDDDRDMALCMFQVERGVTSGIVVVCSGL